jgi:hypothetical protein
VRDGCERLSIVAARINAAQDFIEMISNELVAIATRPREGIAVTDDQPSASRRNHPLRLQALHDAAHVTSADAEQARQLFLGQGHFSLPGAIHGRE